MWFCDGNFWLGFFIWNLSFHFLNQNSLLGFPFNIHQIIPSPDYGYQIHKPQICLLNFPFQVNLFKKISYLSQRVHKSVKFTDTLFALLVSGNNDVKNTKFVIVKHTMWQQQVSYFIWQLNWLVSIGFLWSMKS